MESVSNTQITPQYQNRIKFVKKWLEEPKTQYQLDNLVKKLTSKKDVIDNTYFKGLNIGKGSQTETTARGNLRSLIKNNPDKIGGPEKVKEFYDIMKDVEDQND